tara:strand:+ start:689 stop:1423 length:735 start_codon:yes stop_codon:yes gene_type:complete
MKTVLLCFAAYTGEKKVFFEKYTEPRFKKYAEYHGWELKIVKDYNKYELNRQHPTWMSWLIIKEMLDNKELGDGDNIMSIDADVCVYDITKQFITSKSFGYAIDSCNTHCMGAYTLKINSWSRKLVSAMLNDEMYLKLKDTPTWKMWNDQAAWYTIAGIKRHSWQPFLELENNGWHSNKTEDTKLTVDELYEHVELFPVVWNVTHVAGEGFNEYFINPSHRKNTVFRHFAGGPSWDKSYFLESE